MMNMEKDNHFLRNGLSFIIFNLISLADKGRYESIDTIEKHMYDEDIVEFLMEKYGHEEDFSLFETGTYSIKDVNAAFWDIASYVDGNESRKYGVRNNGLHLLIAVAFDLHSGIR